MNTKRIYAMLLITALLTFVSLGFDYEAVYNNVGLVVNGKGISYALFTEIAALVPISIAIAELGVNKAWILVAVLLIVAMLYAESVISINGVALGTYAFKLLPLN